MTHTHEAVRLYPPGTIIVWEKSLAARQEFLIWLTQRADRDILCRAHLTLLGYTPAGTFDETTSWIRRLEPWHPAFRQLKWAIFDEWLETDDGHDAFHRWAGNDVIMCSRCWL